MHRALYVAHGASFAHLPLMLFTSCRLLSCNHTIANNYLYTQLFLSRTGRFFAHYVNLVSSKAYKKEPFAAMMHGTRENIRPKQATRPPSARNACIFLAPPAICDKKSGRLNTPDARPPQTTWRSNALPIAFRRPYSPCCRTVLTASAVHLSLVLLAVLTLLAVPHFPPSLPLSSLPSFCPGGLRDCGRTTEDDNVLYIMTICRMGNSVIKAIAPGRSLCYNVGRRIII